MNVSYHSHLKLLFEINFRGRTLAKVSHDEWDASHVPPEATSPLNQKISQTFEDTFPKDKIKRRTDGDPESAHLVIPSILHLG